MKRAAIAFLLFFSSVNILAEEFCDKYFLSYKKYATSCADSYGDLSRCIAEKVDNEIGVHPILYKDHGKYDIKTDVKQYNLAMSVTMSGINLNAIYLSNFQGDRRPRILEMYLIGSQDYENSILNNEDIEKLRLSRKNI